MAIAPVATSPNSPVAAPKEKVFRGNLEIYTAADLKKLEGVTHFIGNLIVMVPGQKLSLPSLQKVTGSLNLSNDTAIELKSLKTVTQDFTFGGGPLKSISLPQLTKVGGGLAISSRSYPLPKLGKLDLPRLEQVGSFSMAASGLRTLSLPRLAKANDLAILDSTVMRGLELPKLKSIGYRVDVHGNEKLPQSVLDALTKQLKGAGVAADKIFIGRE